MWRQGLPYELVALLCARDCVGVTEVGTNRGPAIDIILKAGNVPSGNPWCAAFVNWCAEYASVVKNVRSPLEDVTLQAYVPSYQQWARHNGRLMTFDNAYPGCIFMKWSDSKGRWAHMGFVDNPLADMDTFTTIEGNTNSTGGREGLEVARLTRSTTTGVYTFIDWRPM